MKEPFYSMLWITLVLALLGCSTVTTSYDYNLQTDFAKLRTYRWTESSGPANAIADSRIRAAVSRELSAKGFKERENGPADFFVGYEVAVQEKKEYSSIAPLHQSVSYYGQGRRRAPAYWDSEWRTNEYTWKEGTLALNMIDSGGERLLWQGQAEKVLSEKTPEQKQKMIDAAVVKLLAKFPPK